jgi:protein-S-isoprenylcysteine O-methyltransferase Ste14
VSEQPPRVVPPVYFLIALLAMAGLHLLWPITALVAAPWSYLGLLPLVFGLWLAVSSARAFRRAGTPIRPLERSTRLVLTGAYRFTRNPMYLGLACVLAGIALLLSSLSPWLVVPSFVSWIDRRFVRREEALLRATFGASYEDYCRRVRRWL